MVAYHSIIIVVYFSIIIYTFEHASFTMPAVERLAGVLFFCFGESPKTPSSHSTKLSHMT